jgi:hypothetical protein
MISIPIAFKVSKPRNEIDLNNQIDALIRARGDDFRREFPITQFALAKVVPDHEARQADLIIEAKYIRNSTAPSKASEGIAADITKYPSRTIMHLRRILKVNGSVLYPLSGKLLFVLIYLITLINEVYTHVFLCPAQRELVECQYGGPARISGSAGTGKTIVGLQRAGRTTFFSPAISGPADLPVYVA